MATRVTLDAARSYTRAMLPDGSVVQANSRATLRRLWLKTRVESGSPPANADREFEEAICAALPPERQALECRYCEIDELPPELRKERVLRMDDVLRFIKAMGGWLASGGGFVSEDEANRRATICAQCPRNIEIPGCKGCAGLVGKTLQLLSGRETKHDTQLESCEVCGCQNRAAVHFPMSAQAIDLDYPEWCWKRNPS